MNDCFLKIKKSICKSRLCISKKAWASRAAIILRPLQTSFSAHFSRTKSRSRCFELSLLPSDITKLSLLPVVVHCKRKENYSFSQDQVHARVRVESYSRTVSIHHFSRPSHAKPWILMEWNLILVFVSLIGSVTVSESTVPDIIFSQIVGNWPSPRSSRNHDNW